MAGSSGGSARRVAGDPPWNKQTDKQTDRQAPLHCQLQATRSATLRLQFLVGLLTDRLACPETFYVFLNQPYAPFTRLHWFWFCYTVRFLDRSVYLNILETTPASAYVYTAIAASFFPL